ncbi:hypothetical protein OH773_10790 [Buttiauxella sp. WJP83]|uniref:hypothetical protein n=1 Tax=Buttiauxella sp. WJP83 TaxID=2986951 RepID=UPI0022DDDC2E|nr:hypothetical protein [Buttiauxella sp. WJP83]WBM72686.1 hypothetical protein OH773_10790 [Buttiauxella sp. WJP83]
MEEYIAEYFAPQIARTEGLKQRCLIYRVVLVAFASDDSDDEETKYSIDIVRTFDRDFDYGGGKSCTPVVYFEHDGVPLSCSFTQDFSAAMTVFNQLVQVIKANEDLVARIEADRKSEQEEE